MPVQNSRIAFIDLAKGIAIILVVYGHCLRGLVSAGVISQKSPLEASDYIIYTFHMPLFFLLSGLFFQSSARKNPAAFWAARLRTIVYPYFLWSVIQGGIQVILAKSVAVNRGMSEDQLYGILYAPISPFWFLYALLFGNVFAYLFRGIRADVLVMGSFAAFLASSLFIDPQVIKDVTYGVFYFSLGIYVRERDWTRSLPLSWNTTWLLVGGFAVAASYCYLLKIPDRLAIPAAGLGIAATLALCAALVQMDGAAFTVRVLNLVGRCSMAIYVMHILLLSFMRTLLLRGLHIKAALVLMPLEIGTAIVIPIAVQLLVARYRINAFFGLPVVASESPVVPATLRVQSEL